MPCLSISWSTWAAVAIAVSYHLQRDLTIAAEGGAGGADGAAAFTTVDACHACVTGSRINGNIVGVGHAVAGVWLPWLPPSATRRRRKRRVACVWVSVGACSRCFWHVFVTYRNPALVPDAD